MRLFVAIDVSEAVRGKLARLQDQMRSHCAGLRWVEARQVHITLQFLGEVKEQRVGAIAAELEGAARAHARFGIDVRGIGAFPSERAVRVLWAGVEDADGRLLALQADCERRFSRLGFAAERRDFHPHLTLARSKGDGRVKTIREVIEKHAGFDAGGCEVSRIVLYESRLSAKGSVYAAIGQFDLSA